MSHDQAAIINSVETIKLIFQCTDKVQQFQIQNDFTTFQRSAEVLKIINPSRCKSCRTIKF